MVYLLKSTEKGSSFKNTQGYLKLRLNLASICSTLDITPLRSLLRANITNVALALRGWDVTCEAIWSKGPDGLLADGVADLSGLSGASFVWLMSGLGIDHCVDNILNDE